MIGGRRSAPAVKSHVIPATLAPTAAIAATIGKAVLASLPDDSVCHSLSAV